ncbi:hypothetical protein CYFUS_002544 [Cystobacter fuscus]|uniref:FtsH ternary system domain-containing protein n=1 Tax=Cystobacter fuscus TaxID=43 RepID=A0A250J0P8_9BACT|nr:hypothetical protein [Cystobacter fuscus]ATB37123.1 hypothetical protein CYFUS_002544 [Cystobacter fuscus]
MASLILRLQIDPSTGKKDILVKYESDADALPMEHEEEHRRLVDKLIAGGALKASEVGRIIVERETPASTGGEQTPASEDVSARVARKA